jgi:gliding motility-associated lipoprotein GldH
MKMKERNLSVWKFVTLLVILCSLFFFSCNTIDLFEKSATIPGQEWKSGNKPSFTFTISDTTASYNAMLVLRHTDKYNYTNIWLNLSVQYPGQDSAVTFRIDKRLANGDGWLGTGMDDVYDHQIELNSDLAANNISFRRKGDYTFTLQQIMREDPLKHILNAGIRIEKNK